MHLAGQKQSGLPLALLTRRSFVVINSRARKGLALACKTALRHHEDFPKPPSSRIVKTFCGTRSGKNQRYRQY
jgi:hypothetical protein